MVAQVQKNVGDRATICSVALDRGFLDGNLLSQFSVEGLYVYIPANEPGYRHRCTLAGTRGPTAGLVVRLVAARRVQLGEDSKTFKAKPINETVVLRTAQSRIRTRRWSCSTRTLPRPAIVGFDAYDHRSLIENSCNREAKEAWHLENHPKRSEAGVRAHTYFVFVCMVMVAPFVWTVRRPSKARSVGRTGITLYRRKMQMLPLRAPGQQLPVEAPHQLFTQRGSHARDPQPAATAPLLQCALAWL